MNTEPNSNWETVLAKESLVLRVDFSGVGQKITIEMDGKPIMGAFGVGDAMLKVSLKQFMEIFNQTIGQ